MTGSNTIELNQATMIAALQYYLDAVLFRKGKSPLVTGVKDSNAATFYVLVTDRESK